MFLEKREVGGLEAQHDILLSISRKEMVGHLELGAEADVSQLEPLLTSEDIEQLEAAFVAQVQVTSDCCLN